MHERSDTSSEAREIQFAIDRRMSGAQRLTLAMEMGEQAKEISKSGVRARHPDYSEEQVEFAVRRLILGDELFAAAYPDRPLLPSGTTSSPASWRCSKSSRSPK